MLIRFSVENFLSYKERNTFSMIKSAERSHENHVQNGKYISLLKGAVIYGANASGKSNLIKAVSLAQNLITKPRDKDRLFTDNRYKLCEECKKTPTRFEFEFEYSNVVYAYGFSWVPERIEEEWLFTIGKTIESNIFERKNGRTNFGNRDNTELVSIAQKVPPKQLLLNFLNQMEVDNEKDTLLRACKNCFNWFENSLHILFPEHRFSDWAKINSDKLTKDFIKNALSSFGIPLSDINFVDININQLALPKSLINKIFEETPEGESARITGFDYNFYILTKVNGELNAQELKFLHKSDNNEMKEFSFSEESDGTKRLTDFLPLFLTITDEEDPTIFIDEIDRSLHTELTYSLIEQLLSIESNFQIITTTHDTSLLDLDLLRRDEIWFSERKAGRGSFIYSLIGFKPRKDKDIKKDYLVGRYGAIPFFGINMNSFLEDVNGKR